jgi:hypothetical protein
MIKSIKSGYLDKFDKDLEKLVKSKSTFKVISSGLTRKIVFNDNDETYKRVYFGTSRKDILPGVYLVNAVRKDVDDYIQKEGQITMSLYKPKLILYNYKRISDAIATGPKIIHAIDINACYFTTAFNLGYITQKTYDKAWGKRKQYKLGLLASIGSLNKHELIEEFKAGEIEDTRMNWEFKNRYSPFYWEVINYVAKVMMEIAHALGDDFYMWLTDCVYLEKGKQHVIEEILNKHGYAYKSFVIEFEAMTERKITWYDFKSREQKIIHHNIMLGYHEKYTPFIETKYE